MVGSPLLQGEDGGGHERRLRVVEPAEGEEAPVPASGVEPAVRLAVGAYGVAAPMSRRNLPSSPTVVVALVAELVRRRGSMHSCQMFSTVTLQ